MSFEPVKDPVVVLKLETPIQYLGQEIGEIAMRAPTAGDLFRVGNPVKYDARDDSIDFDEQKSFAMLNALTGIPILGSLDRMTTNDAVTCFWGFARFFIPGLRSRREDTSATSPKPAEQPVS